MRRRALSLLFNGYGGPLFKGLLVVCMTIVGAQAAPIVGTVLTAPGSNVSPGLIAPGTSAGVLLASLVAPYSFSTTAGATSGTVTSAVYRNSTGTLDFYYQVSNSASSATSLARETDISFAGFTTWTGYRVDALGPFVAGTVAPVTADRNAGVGTVVGFSFNPPDSAKVLPGLTSNILVISTDATNFTAGNASVIDGGTQTVAAFQPAASIPEPTTTLLIGAGLVGVAALRLRR